MPGVSRRDLLRLLVAAAPALALGRGARAAAADAGPRHALVIGNAAYDAEPLRNAVHDARQVAHALHEVGFEVRGLENAGRQEMLDAMRDWMVESQECAVRFLYFAGHGVQVGGRNYLLPVDLRAFDGEAIAGEAVDATQFTESIALFPVGVNVIVLDACRNDPSRSVALARAGHTRGLASRKAPGLAPPVPVRGTIIAFSTAPGALASDGLGDSGIYARHLAADIAAPGMTIEQVFKAVRTQVAHETGNRQVPWESSSLVGELCLNDSARAACGSARGGPVVGF